MIAKSYRWPLTAVATAALLGLGAGNALAMSLGRISVQSALGEPLKAVVEVLDINAEEASTLTVNLAPPESFKAAGLDYNAALNGLRAKLQRHPDGRAYISLSSDRIVNDPYIDLVLETSWNTGKIVRDYTLLFDPPSLRVAAPNVVTPAQTSATPATAARPASISQTRVPVASPTSSPAANNTKPTASKAASASKEQTLTVKTGETAGKIAASHRPADVSLDQMLVAMLRSSPDAFIGGNVNRIKAGALIALPSQAQASETPDAKAKQIILAQSQDFNNFRRNLASAVPTAKVAPSVREASGKIQANVADKKPAAASPDKLTLSKGAITHNSDEAKLAQARNAKEAASRAKEVAKNLKDLNQIATAASAASSAVSATAAAAVKAPVMAASTAASASASISTPMPVASPPANVASKPLTPASTAESSFIDDLLADPLVPGGALGLIALLAGFGIYQAKKRKRDASLDSTFADSKLQPDSFFGNSGGKNVNTTDSGVTGSSMIYSPSQLDAVDDVDPVAEADVYLAYGRDLQAEEILKDALRTKPERLAIHHKLLEIYAKRKDAKAYEAIATLVFNLTNGMGQDWDPVCEKGLALDPNNALYLPGGQPQFDPNAATVPAGIDTVSPGLDALGGAPEPDTKVADPKATELDLDLDFSLDEPDLPGGLLDTQQTEVAANDTQALPVIEAPSKEETWSEPEPMELMALQAAFKQSLPEAASTSAQPTPDFPSTINAPDVQEPDNSINFDQTQVISAPKAEEVPAKNSGMMAFDIGDLSLDFAQPSANQPAAPDAQASTESMDEPATQPGAFPEVTGDPLETKLALAEEFKAIGDDDGARALIEEVISEASGDMKIKAQQALNKL